MLAQAFLPSLRHHYLDRGQLSRPWEHTHRSRVSCSPPISFVLEISFSKLGPVSIFMSRRERREPTGQFVHRVLVVLIAELIHAHEGAGLGIACSLSEKSIASHLRPMQ